MIIPDIPPPGDECGTQSTPQQPHELSDEDLVGAWSDIVRLVQATDARILADVETDSVPAQWFAVLHLLAKAPDHRLPMSHIARDLTMTGGGFTKLADRMARDGLIDRRSAPGDRRIVNATLTPAGEALAVQLESRYRDGLHTHVLGAVSADQLRALHDLAGKLTAVGLRVDVPEFPAAAEGRDPSLPERRRQPRP